MFWITVRSRAKVRGGGGGGEDRFVVIHVKIAPDRGTKSVIKFVKNIPLYHGFVY